MKRPAINILIFAFCLVFFIALIVPKWMQVGTLRARSRNLEAELIQMKHQNEALENELRLLRDDPVYLERVARKKFNKAKQGEVVYKVVREGDATAPAS